MRNLKRALSLALAAFMLIGMMVVGASAATKDFTDSDEITHSEAVNTLVALNVIGGKEDGSYFDPTGTLTRAEMAKLVTYILNGGVEPVLGTKVTPTYSDIGGHWAEAYIEYCTSMGIIVGDGTGKFNPEGTLTASQCAKMLLTAMNYDADVFGFTGDSWEINVNREANAAGLYDELGSISASAAISRDDAAQMVYNAIQAKTMKLTWTQDMSTGEISQTYTLTGNSLFEDKFGGERTVLTFAGDYHVNSSLKDGQLYLTGSYTVNETNRTNATITYTLDNGNEWIGEKVEVLWKDNTTKGTKNMLDKEDTIYGLYPNGETSVLNVTSDDIKSASDYDTTGKIKVDGTEYDVATPASGDALVVTNYDASTAVKASGSDSDDLIASAKAAFSALSQQNGDTVKFILNDENKVEIAYVQTYKLGTVTAVNSEKVTISGLGSIVIADNEIYDGIAKNDVVVYSKLYNSDLDDAYVVVTEAESVSGTVDGYKTTESVTLDGTVYDLYYTGGAAKLESSVGGEKGTTAFGTTDIGETFTLYLVNGYVAGAVQTSESATNYSLVVDKNTGTAGDNWEPLKLVVLAADGTKTTLTVDDDSTLKKATDYHIGDIITWTGSADDALVDVEAAFVTSVSDNNYEKVTANGVIYDDTSKTFNDVVTATDCVLFVTTDGSTAAGSSNLNADRTFKAYNIRSLKDVKAGSNDVHTICVIDDGKVVAAFALLGNTPSGASGSAVYGIVTADNGTVKVDDKYYNQYVIASNDDTYTVNVGNSGELEKGAIYGFAPASDNLYDQDDFALLSNSSLSSVTVDGSTYVADVIAVKEYDESDSLLTYYTATKKSDDGTYFVGDGAATTKAVADDVTIVYVDVDGNVAGDEIGVNAFDSVTGNMNAIIVLDDGVITHIIVETSGEGNVYDY